jgi:hypothetical protein
MLRRTIIWSNIISNQYDGVGYNWSTGKVSWRYKYVPDYPYESVYAESETGEESYPWFTGGSRIADGVLYAYNDEHSSASLSGDQVSCYQHHCGE